MLRHAPLATSLALTAGLVFASTTTAQTSAEFVKDINLNPVSSSNPSSYPYPSRTSTSGNAQKWAMMDGWFYFVATHSATGAELYKSDGTKAILVKDIYKGTSSSSPSYFTVVGKMIFFRARTAAAGYELWATDGTEKGTTMVADIYPGTSSSSPGNLARIGAKVCFTAYTPSTGYELWITDGTTKGTVLLKDVRPGSSSGLSSFSSYATTTRIGHRVFFQANDGKTGTELWVTDGTAKGTIPVMDIYVGLGSSSPRYFLSLGVTQVVFEARTATTGVELWISDGTAKGTTMVKEIYKGTVQGAYLTYGVSLGAKVLFLGRTTTNGSEPWITDGTDKGTMLLKDIRTGTLSSSMYYSDADNGLAYWGARSTSGYEIWVTDGTPANTKLFSKAAMSNGAPSYLAATNGMVFFQGYYVTPSTGYEICMTDGKTTTTVKDIRPGSSSGYAYYCSKIAKGVVAFAAQDLNHGRELWISKGTAATTTLIDINKPIGAEPTANDAVSYIEPLFGKVIFAATDGTDKTKKQHGQELWCSDGTEKGTELLKDIYVGTSTTTASSSNPRYMCRLGNHVYFAATDATNGTEVWRTDGSTEGTKLFKDIRTGSLSSLPSGFARIKDKIYFRANDGTHGYELWVTDGTDKGTYMVRDLVSGSGSSSPAYFAPLGITGKCVFSAYLGGPGGPGTELWITDGTDKGTLLLKDIHTGALSSYPAYMKCSGDMVYFQAYTATTGYELWRTDGTEKGTTLVKDLYLGASSAYARYIESQNSVVYYYAWASGAGYELHRSDGNADGTYLYWDLYFGSSSSYPNYITAVGSRRVYLSANVRDTTTSYGYEPVWFDTTVSSSDLHNINSNSGSSYPTNFAGGSARFAVEGGNVYMAARRSNVFDNQLLKLVNGATAQNIGRAQHSSTLTATDPRIGKIMTLKGMTTVDNPLSVLIVGIETTSPLMLDPFVADSYAYFDLTRFFVIIGNLPGKTWTMSFTVPNDGTLLGDRAVFQSFALDAKLFPGKTEVTNGVHTTFGM